MAREWIIIRLMRWLIRNKMVIVCVVGVEREEEEGEESKQYEGGKQKTEHI